MIVVGAGIIGLSCAWRLAQRGVAVTVFDSREVAAEASWAGAGMLAPGGEISSNEDAARLAVRSLAAFPAFVGELERASGLPIDLRLCGALDVAYTEEEAAELEQKAVWQSHFDIPSRPVNHLGAVSARFYPNDSMVDPRQVTASLRVACELNGVTFHEHEPVLEIYPEGSVRTLRGEYRDHAVLISAGAWSTELLSNPVPGLPRTMPVRGHLIGYATRPGMLESILRHGHTYLLQRTNGMLIAGASTENVGFDRSLDEVALAELKLRAERLLPALRQMAPTERWNGFRPGIDATGPFIGKVAGTGLWAAFGHYRNGILLAPETAKLIASGYSQA